MANKAYSHSENEIPDQYFSISASDEANNIVVVKVEESEENSPKNPETTKHCEIANIEDEPLSDTKMFLDQYVPSFALGGNGAAVINNKNTRQSTNSWIRIYQQWATARSITPNLEELDGQSMDAVLSQFYVELKKQNGQDYEPSCLRVMQSALHRYLVEKAYPLSILRDPVFVKSQRVLDRKSRMLKDKGMGQKAKKQAMDVNDIEVLWREQKLGDQCPNTLVRTMWFLFSQHFGSLGCREHAALMVEDFLFLRDSSNSECVVYKPSLAEQKKMMATGGPRCPVRLFKLYISKRPQNMRTSGRFYLIPKCNCLNSEGVWYSKNHMGKNTIGTFRKALTEGTPLEDSNKKIAPYSFRKRKFSDDEEEVDVKRHFRDCSPVDMEEISNDIQNNLTSAELENAVYYPLFPLPTQQGCTPSFLLSENSHSSTKPCPDNTSSATKIKTSDDEMPSIEDDEGRSAKDQEIIKLTQRLIASITMADFETYSKLCDERMTAFEPEAHGNLVEGLDFHKFYFDNSVKGAPINTTILSPHVTFLSEESALITYIRLTQRMQSDNRGPATVQSEETRVWQRKGSRWLCVHFHRSCNGK